MKSYILLFVVIIFFENCDLRHCLRVMQVIPGPPALSYFDSTYIEDVVLKTRRTHKRGDLAVNIEFTAKVPWGNNVSCLRVLQVIPGPPALSYFDSTYIEEIVLKTRRTHKRGDLAVNIEFTSKVPLGNNVSAHFIFYEYLHNEYRRSFVEVHYKLCDLILKDIYIGSVVRIAGINVCPLPPARYHMMNLTFNREFPSVFPFEKGKAELILNAEPSGKEIARGDLVVTFKMKNKF